MILPIIILAMACTGIYLANQYYKKKNQAPPTQSISDNVQKMMSKYSSEAEAKKEVEVTQQEIDIVELPAKKKKKYYHHKKI